MTRMWQVWPYIVQKYVRIFEIWTEQCSDIFRPIHPPLNLNTSDQKYRYIVNQKYVMYLDRFKIMNKFLDAP